MLMFAAVVLAAPASVAANGCDLKQFASLEITIGPGGGLLVPVTIQDTHAFMRLNTATGANLLYETAARQLGLELSRNRNTSYRVAESFVEKQAAAKGFSLGDAQFKNADFMIFPNAQLPRGMSPDVVSTIAGLPVVGILGMGTLTGIFDFELDLANRKLKLFSQDHCRRRVVYWAQTFDSAPVSFGAAGEVYFPMELDGKKVEATLATMFQTTSLSTDASRRLFKLDISSPEVEKDIGPAGNTTAHYRAMKLTGKGLGIANARIDLFERPPTFNCRLGEVDGVVAYENCRGVHPLSLGVNVLSKLRIYVSVREKLIYFTPATGPS